MMFKLPYIPTAEKLIDDAFRRGSVEAKKVRSTRKPRATRLRVSEERRVSVVGNYIVNSLTAIIKNFPSYEQLPPFYQRLLDIKIDKNRYKKSLGSMQWCIDSVKKLEKKAIEDIRKNKVSASKNFLGRASSVVKRVKPELENLIDIKKTLLLFPDIKEMPTVVVAGYPNVGKSTFVRNLTKAKIKIDVYPFTTKDIMLGYKTFNHVTYQIIDSPGLLDRPMESRNRIELQAILALEELADLIIFLIDPLSEIEKQRSLLKEIEKSFKTKIVVAMNKTDTVDKEELIRIREKFKESSPREISAIREEECNLLFAEIIKS